MSISLVRSLSVAPKNHKITTLAYLPRPCCSSTIRQTMWDRYRTITRSIILYLVSLNSNFLAKPPNLSAVLSLPIIALLKSKIAASSQWTISCTLTKNWIRISETKRIQTLSKTLLDTLLKQVILTNKAQKATIRMITRGHASTTQTRRPTSWTKWGAKTTKSRTTASHSTCQTVSMEAQTISRTRRTILRWVLAQLWVSTVAWSVCALQRSRISCSGSTVVLTLSWHVKHPLSFHWELEAALSKVTAPSYSKSWMARFRNVRHMASKLLWRKYSHCQAKSKRWRR